MNLHEFIGSMNNTTVGNSSEGLSWDTWNPPYIVRVDRTYYAISAIYFSLLWATGVPLNSFVLYVFYKNPILRTPINYIVISLIVADLSTLLSSVSVGVVTNTAGHFLLGKTACTVEGFIISVTSVASLNSMVLLAVVRCLVICKPIGSYQLNKKHSIVGVVIAWLYSLVWHSVFLTWDDGYEAEGIGTNCAPNYFSKAKDQKIFMVFYFIFCFLIPVLVMTVSYILLIRVVRKKLKHANKIFKRKSAKDREITKSVVVLVTAFCICWAPYAVVSMISVFAKEPSYIIGVIPSYFAKGACLYNPIIHTATNRQFRDCVVETIFGKQYCNHKSADTLTTLRVTTLRINQA